MKAGNEAWKQVEFNSTGLSLMPFVGVFHRGVLVEMLPWPWDHGRFLRFWGVDGLLFGVDGR